ncbi:MAG TPA: protein phosphatase 2C domain-containing protein [Gemmataceae bacterium]|nr:protein phosphatase 2C domain-containing protein [Gemmataceae bacterium]
MTGFEKIEHASRTDVGVRRSHNQDSHAVLLAGDLDHWRDKGHIFLVADGMGGHAVGELASELAVGIIPHTYHKHAEEGAAAALRKAFQEANASIHARGQQNLEFKGMGTTSTALLLRPEGAWIGHVGDSRVYRIRDGRIEQLTFDHSHIWELARKHRIDPDELQGVRSNIISRSLGPDPLVRVDIEGPHPVRAGDIFVLCSDGLSGPVSDPELGAVTSLLPPAEACQFLVDLANLRGGPDNITVMIVRIGEQETGEADGVATRGLQPRGGSLRRVLVKALRWIPWPLLLLLLGSVLAVEALVLMASNQRALGTFAFGGAAAAIIGGLIALVVHFLREKQHVSRKPERRSLQVYRKASSLVEPPLLEKLRKLEHGLYELVREKGWETDWETHRQHHEAAEKSLEQGDVSAAFRETCRAVQPLTATLQQQRNKVEAFQPLWDIASD